MNNRETIFYTFSFDWLRCRNPVSSPRPLALAKDVMDEESSNQYDQYSGLGGVRNPNLIILTENRNFVGLGPFQS